MGLETGTWIEDLDENWPLGTDFKSQGDDHIRLIKKILKDQFPNLGAEAVERTAAEINAFPTIAGYLANGLSVTYTGDLDDIAVNSQYTFDATGVSNNPADMTSGAGTILTMMSGSDTSGIQIIYGRSGTINQNKMWMRASASSTWTDWVLIVDNGAFTTRLAGYGDNGFGLEYTGDLNAVPANSHYWIVPSNVTNEPAEMTQLGWVTSMFGVGTDNGVQVIYGSQGGDWKMWYRSATSAVWSAWKLVVDGGAFTTRLAGYKDDGLSDNSPIDLDAVTSNSTYFVVSNAINTPADYNVTEGGYLTTYIQSLATTVVQILYGWANENANKIWMRYQSSGLTFSDWRLVVNGQGLEFDDDDEAILSQAPTKDGSATRKDYVDQATPIGSVMMWPLNAAPSGYLLCSGQDVSRTTEAALFAVIGVTYGVGNGTTTFGVPDYRGMFMRGWDNGRGLDPDAASRTGVVTGDNVGSEQADQNASHQHPIAGDHTHQLNTFQSGASTAVTYPQIDTDDSETPEVLTEPTTVNGAHQHDASGGDEARPVNIGINFVIRVK